MELKEQLKQHLTEKKENERLERVKINSNLKTVTIYTNDQPYSKTVKESLDSEGIKYVEKTLAKNKSECAEMIAITNLNAYPTIEVNGNYLVTGRDYQQPQQLISAIQHLADPEFKSPKFEARMLENFKTSQYHLFTRLTQLEQRLNPLVEMMSKLMNEIDEEENPQSKKTQPTPKQNVSGGCGGK